MSKHTPGPWHIGGRTILRPTLTIFHKPFGLGDVAEVYEEVDARLIAAAPDLLEVVQKFVAWSEAERNPSGTTFWQRVEMCREVDALASAAIAKVEGTTE